MQSVEMNVRIAQAENEIKMIQTRLKHLTERTEMLKSDLWRIRNISESGRSLDTAPANSVAEPTRE